MSRPVSRLPIAVAAVLAMAPLASLVAQGGPPARPGTPVARPTAAPARPATPAARPARLASAPGGDTPVTTGLVRGNAPGEWR